jgi:hypothetical protein
MRCANGTAEFLEKIIGVFDKSLHVNFQAEEYRRSFVEDKAAFSRVHRSPYGIYQLKIIVKGKGDPGGKDFVWRKRQQFRLYQLAQLFFAVQSVVLYKTDLHIYLHWHCKPSTW